MNRTARRRLPWVAFATMTLVIGTAVCIFIVLPMWNERPLRFEPGLWKSAPRLDSPESVRLRMVDSLLSSSLLSGRTRSEVESLIGPPDTTTYFREFDMVYQLGPERSFFSIDSEWLVIRLDASGRVSTAQLVTD